MAQVVHKLPATEATFANRQKLPLLKWARKALGRMPQFTSELKPQLLADPDTMELELKIPYYGLRMTVRPGVTGWAQVEYGYGSTEEDALEKLKYDLYYIKNSNLLFDLWIVLKTVKVVLSGRG